MHDPAGDRFRALVEVHGTALAGYARRRTTSADDAADLVADTLLVAWRRIGEVPPEPDTRPWLFGVARRTLANRRRGDGRRDRLVERLGRELARVPIAVDEALGDRDAVGRALGRLDPDDRELLTLTAWEGLTPAALATAFGIPAATVRTRLFRARGRLRRELDAEGFDERSGPTGHDDGAGQPLGSTLEHDR